MEELELTRNRIDALIAERNKKLKRLWSIVNAMKEINDSREKDKAEYFTRLYGNPNGLGLVYDKSGKIIDYTKGKKQEFPQPN